MPVLLTAAQCGLEPPPANPAGAAFQRACDARQLGHYSEAIRGFQESARLAHENGDTHWEAKSLVLVGSSQCLSFQYGSALKTIESAAALAKQSGDKAVAAGAELNISTIYVQLGNFAISQRKMLEAIRELQQTTRSDLLAQAYYALSYQQIRFGEIQAGLRSSELAIHAAQQAKQPEFEARAWDFRGVALLLTGHLEEAENSLGQAVAMYQKRLEKPIPSIVLEHLAELKWRQKQNAAALNYVDEAFAHADVVFKAAPQYYPLNVRAHILQDLGRADEALAAYRRAVDAANLWRRAALPGDTTNSQTVQQLNNTYQAFAEFAAEQSFVRHDGALAREALQAIAQNRASTLREQLALELGRNEVLPSKYLIKLGELQALQARITLANDAVSQQKLSDLECEIDELETKIGLSARKIALSAENNSGRNSLRDIQIALGPTEALLSFCLGEKQSYLWAVTGETVELYRLPAARGIGQGAKDLREGLEHHQSYASAANNLRDVLFSQLDAKFWTKRDWLIVGDGALLDRVPFSVIPGKSGEALIERHTVRVLPSELMILDRAANNAQGRFVGIADPLYNLADSRRGRRPALLTDAATTRGTGGLARLPGSQREIRTAARYSGMRESDLLIGPDANLTALAAALEQHPAIIHFAVHVVSPPGHPEQAALALSLGKDNLPELLTRERIASLRVPGSLVVLSGCSSAQGQTAPSTGLVGLSRAWLLAGASAVVVSNWPTPDDSGQFFSIFYSQLASYRSYSSSSSQLSGAHSDLLAQRAASALQQTQLQLRERGGYGSSPAFWAAYSIVSKE
ncbi:MAG: CHAT domain-containing protein [Acidobacteriaceae bacterium]|nr:CHAT domain-containing protein [Acidobacteriaceae bacterium]